MTKRKAKPCLPIKRVGVFRNIGRYSGPFNARFYADQALKTLYSRLWMYSRGAYAPMKVESTRGTEPRGRPEMTLTYPIVLEHKMDQSWCYTCKAPKSVCGAKTKIASPPTVLFVGGPRDGERGPDYPSDVFHIPLSSEPNFGRALTPDAFDAVFRTGTYRRVNMSVADANGNAVRHVVWAWAGENAPGDNLDFNGYCWKVTTTSPRGLTASRETAKDVTLDAAVADVYFDAAAYPAHTPHGTWRLRTGAPVSILQKWSLTA